MACVRFDHFEFDPDSGELVRRDDNGNSDRRRLPPQPARLLALLVEKRGDLLTREEIREQLWPGVQVEFESGLHFCIRQVRRALDDSATEPRYIETLPRRGYRLLPPVETLEAREPEARRGVDFRKVTLLLVILGLGATIIFLATRPSTESSVRIAIMPFDPGPLSVSGGSPTRIAEGLLLSLGRARGTRPLELVGPTTTSSLTDRPLEKLGRELRVDYVINGRFLETDAGTTLLAEFIRATDGVHVWVERFEDLEEWEEIRDTITREVISRFALQTP